MRQFAFHRFWIDIIGVRLILALLVASSLCCSAQEKPINLVLRVQETSSGPFGGQKGAFCLNLYSDGRIAYSHWSTSAMGVQDENGKVTHPEIRGNRTFTFPERDSWQVSDFITFLDSKAVRNLRPFFGPPHRAIDFFETSTVEILLPKRSTKQIQIQEYYVASLVEKAKYPAALIILMDRIEQFENTAADKGTSTEESADCKLVP